MTSHSASFDRRTRARRVVPALMACAVLAGAASCSSSDDKSAKSTTPDKTSKTTVKPQASAKVVLDELLTKDFEWSAYLEAATRAQVTETLSGKGPYTLLIPKSAAFGKKVPGALGATPEALALGVRRHIIEGKLALSDLAALNGKTVTMLSGDKLKVTIVKGTVNVGGVPLIKSDISAKNGVIHVADKIIPEPA